MVKGVLEANSIQSEDQTRVEPRSPMVIEIFTTKDGRAIAVDAVCDGGDQGCGGGLLILMLQAIKRLESGAVLEVRSTDPGVREDLPAWCRMTGHQLLAEQEGNLRNRYFLRKA